MDFQEFSQKEQGSFEEHLLHYIQKKSKTALEEAMLYSLDAKGKRVRPLLLLAILDSFNINLSIAYPTASALEMIHTYSLIHDDLPAMDNDKIRRGKKTNHIQFDEATAILAGDALLTLAFEVILEGELAAEIKIKLSRLLAKSAGYRGMVGGQQADIEGENRSLTLSDIESIHQRKTGALIKMAVLSAGIIAGKNKAILKELKEFAKALGIAYQIRDDLLDQLASEEDLGKAVMTDTALEKSTYPLLLGIEGSFEALNQKLKEADRRIQKIKEKDSQFKTELLSTFIKELSLEEYQ